MYGSWCCDALRFAVTRCASSRRASKSSSLGVTIVGCWQRRGSATARRRGGASNALRCAQVHHPPDNGGASTRCAQGRRCGQKREPRPKPAGLGAAGVTMAEKNAVCLGL